MTAHSYIGLLSYHASFLLPQLHPFFGAGDESLIAGSALVLRPRGGSMGDMGQTI
jgi:hypothetical protein